jgi:hypothetical protein
MTISVFIFKHFYKFFFKYLTKYNMNFARLIRKGQNPKLFNEFQLDIRPYAPDARLSLPSQDKIKWLLTRTFKLYYLF